MNRKNKHSGSSFDGFLKEEGLLTEVTEAAEKHVKKFQKDLRDLRGKIEFHEEYDYKALRK